MTPRERLLALILSFVGLAACTGAVMAFVLNVMRNKLPWHPHQSAREYYLAVGQYPAMEAKRPRRRRANDAAFASERLSVRRVVHCYLLSSPMWEKRARCA